MNGKKQSYLVVGLSVLSMVFLIYIGSNLLRNVRFDFTEEKSYTLSKGSKQILQKLNQPLRAKLYYSKTAANKGTEGIRAFNTYFFYIRDLLEEYVSYSRNNLELEVIDPRPDTKEEEDAMAYGLKKFNLTETESYFFGLVIENNQGVEKVIEFFNPQEQEKVEYEITKLIYTVFHPDKKKVGILSSLEVLSGETNPYLMQMMRMQGKNPQDSWVITKLMKEFYEVSKIGPDTTDISGIDILMVIHPKNLTDATQFAIDQFVLKGGNVLIFLDAFATVDQSGNPYMPGPQSSNLSKLLSNWNVKFNEDKFVGDKQLSAYGRVSQNGPATRLLPFLNCDQRCFENSQESISAGLSNLTMVFPGELEIIDSNKKEFKTSVILSTTTNGNTYKAGPYELNSPQILWNKFKEGIKSVPLGLKIVGKFKTAFPEGVSYEEKTNEGKKEVTKTKKLTGITEAAKESAIIIYPDVDFISDRYAFQQTIFGTAMQNENANLALNSLELLAGSKELLSIRSKGQKRREFTVINNIELEAEKMTASKVEEINSNISKYTEELNKLGEAANENNMALIANEGLRKKRELAKKIALLKGELREVKREGREKVESIGRVFQYINTLLVPLALLIMGLFVFLNRKKKMLS